MLAAEVVALLIGSNLLFGLELVIVLMVLGIALLWSNLVHVRLPAFLLLIGQEQLPLCRVGRFSAVDINCVQQTCATASFFQKKLTEVVLIDVVVV